MSRLKLRPGTGANVHDVTPASAGWAHVGFAVRRLSPATGPERGRGEGREVCLVFVAGRGRVRVGGAELGLLGGRASPFDGPPDAVYVPPGLGWEVVPDGDIELAICSAPARGGLSRRVIPASGITTERRGVGTNTRHVWNILPETEPAESLLVVEVITPPGHWSSYPPHKHDTLDLPRESLLEETYYHRLSPPTGYAHQRVYTDDRALDETLTVEDGDVVLVPRGYHPVAAAHGYTLWYLNVMAGPVRTWKFTDDPAHAWLKGR